MGKRTFITKAVTVLLLTFFAIACGGEKQNESSSQKTDAESAEQEERIYTDLTLSRVQGLKKGDTLTVSLSNNNEVYQLAIKDNKENIPGTRSIRADIEDQETGIASLLIRDNMLSGSMQFYQDDLFYTIDYDSTNQSYYLNSVPAEEREEMEGSAPLVPKH